MFARLVLSWLACADDTPLPTTSPPTTDTPPTDTTTPPVSTSADVLAASCALDANPLRVTCGVTLAAPGTVAVELTAEGAPTRTFTSSGGAQQEILVWGLRPATEYTWRVGEQSGAITTGALPSALSAATVSVTGAAFGFDAVLVPMRCPGTDYFAMVDGDGQVVWYEPNDVYFSGFMAGYDWSQATRTLLTVRATTFQEQDVGGDVVLALEQGVDYDGDLHHDVARWGDYRYLLYEYPVGPRMVDGVHVFDGDVLLGTFDVADHFDPPSAGSGDWGHGNAVKVTETGEVVLSLHSFSSVIAFDGDPASPTFLDLRWVANGQPAGLPDPDYTAVAGAGEGFELQHNTSRHGDDLWVFDNRSQATSRAIRMAMDHAAGTLAVTGSWSLDRVCTNQGGAIPLDGGALVSCANGGFVEALAEGAAEPAWTLTVDCGEDGGTGTLPILRGIPVQID